MKKLNQNGFIPLLLALLAIIIALIVFVYLRVLHANK
jgi:hypothetical protein